MAQSKPKTVPTEASVEDYLGAIADPGRREDCRKLAELMSEVTGEPARMWGAGIVGFGRYHYRYESGREGEMCLIGFASRKGDISVYAHAPEDTRAPLLEKLGKHKTGKGCLYIKRLLDIDRDVLRQILAASVAELRRRYPDGAEGGGSAR
ncbi:MAG: DUF1801 domain-containing protein [Isosphaeraceae bacterium]